MQGNRALQDTLHIPAVCDSSNQHHRRRYEWRRSLSQTFLPYSTLGVYEDI